MTDTNDFISLTLTVSDDGIYTFQDNFGPQATRTVKTLGTALRYIWSVCHWDIAEHGHRWTTKTAHKSKFNKEMASATLSKLISGKFNKKPRSPEWIQWAKNMLYLNEKTDNKPATPTPPPSPKLESPGLDELWEMVKAMKQEIADLKSQLKDKEYVQVDLLTRPSLDDMVQSVEMKIVKTPPITSSDDEASTEIDLDEQYVRFDEIMEFNSQLDQQVEEEDDTYLYYINPEFDEPEEGDSNEVLKWKQGEQLKIKNNKARDILQMKARGEPVTWFDREDVQLFIRENTTPKEKERLLSGKTYSKRNFHRITRVKNWLVPRSITSNKNPKLLIMSDKAKKNRENVAKYLANPENKQKIYKTRFMTKLRKGESVRVSTLEKYGLLAEALEKYPKQVTGKIPKPKIDVKEFFDEPEVIDLVSPTAKAKVDVKEFFSDSENEKETGQAKPGKTMSLEDIISQIEDIPEAKLKPKSKRTYINKLRAIAKYADCDSEDFIPCFQNASKTVPLILKAAPIYGIQYLAVFKSLIKYLPDFAKQFSPNIIKHYEQEMVNSKDQLEDHIQAKKKIPPTPWSKFRLASERAEDEDRFSQEHLITALYTEYPPIRDDYGEVRITTKDLDTGNYYNTKTKKLHLNDYKTSGKYGGQVISLPKPLTDLIHGSLLKKPRNYLFTRLDTTKPYGKMTGFVKKVFAKYADIPESKANINHLRHSYVSHEYAKADFNLAAKRKLARKMLHDVETAKNMYLSQSVLTGEDN